MCLCFTARYSSGSGAVGNVYNAVFASVASAVMLVAVKVITEVMEQIAMVSGDVKFPPRRMLPLSTLKTVEECEQS